MSSACRVPLARCSVYACTASTLSTCPWRGVYASQPRHVVNMRHCTTPVYACVVYASHLARMPCPWRDVCASQPCHVVNMRHCTTPVYACVVYASHLARMPCPWRGVYSSQPRHVVDVRHCTRTAPPPSPPHAPMPSWTCELRKTSKTCIGEREREAGGVREAGLDLRAASVRDAECPMANAVTPARSNCSSDESFITHERAVHQTNLSSRTSCFAQGRREPLGEQHPTDNHRLLLEHHLTTI